MTLNAITLEKSHLDLAIQNNWFKLFVSKKFNGGEATLPEALQVYFDASSIDGSLGWCVNLGSGASIFSGYLSEEAAMGVFSKPKNVCAGSGGVGTFKESANGYLLSGSWDKCTGSAHASHFTVNAKNEQGELYSFVIPKDQVQVSDEYYLDGLERSSSVSITVNEATIPLHYKFEINTIFEESSYLIHQIDFETFAKFCMLASILGMGQCLVNKAKADNQLYPDRAETNVDEFEAFIEVSFQEVMDLSKEAWRELEELDIISKDLKERLDLIIPHTNKGLFDRANELLYIGGLRLKDKRTDVHGAYQDLVLACQHYILK